MKVEKFPSFKFNSRNLVWDSRQKLSDPLVVLRKGLDSQILSELSKISSEHIEEGVDFISWGKLLSEISGNPSHKLTVIGVVGTNGKTTTAALLRHLCVECGKRVLELGTLGAQLWAANNNKEYLWKEVTGFTSPDAATLQDLLKQAVQEKVDVVVMEVTSHAIALGRVDGIEFDAALFLNFSQDHLDFHKTLEAYKAVKKSFFTEFLTRQQHKIRPLQVINTGDTAGAELRTELSMMEAENVSVVEKSKSYFVKATPDGIEYQEQGKAFVQLPLYGTFLAENVATSVTLVSKLLGKEPQELVEMLKSFSGAPGRMQKLNLCFAGKKRRLLVDFAHTPESLRSVLQSLRESIQQQNETKLWVVFGCGGDRDKLKRPIMGQIAEELADRIVLTSDNPRTENPEVIIDEIQVALQKKSFDRFVDRREAFAFALKEMSENDICLIAGRGHEEFQIVGTEKRAFLDAAVLNDLCAKSN